MPTPPARRFPRLQFRVLAAGVLAVGAAACSRSYPEDLGRAERKRYYEDFNASRTPAQWDSVRAAQARSAAAVQPRAAAAETQASVPFRIRNAGPLPARVEIEGNVLAFKPFELRYVGFPPGARGFRYDSGAPEGRGARLFTVAAADSGRTFRIRR